tara:strand:- start:387 stop:1490 length:1104 start_codon:yes stop_codon:yes gene_type:complete
MNRDNETDYVFFGFTCVKCNYRCNKRSDLNRHFSTQKHKRNMLNVDKQKKMNIQHGEAPPAVNTIQQPPEHKPAMLNVVQSLKSHKCVCGKVYKHMSSLCKHKKTCKYVDTIEIKEKSYVNDASKNVLDLVPLDASAVKVVSDVSMTNIVNIITEQAKRNDELKELLKEQSKHIVKMSETAMTVTNNITTNNTVNNNKINFNLFLNNECKNAMNIMDFIDSLPMNVRDLENMGNFGFVEGMTRILLNGLKKLDFYQRPIHCTDIKRESIYIKDKDEWEKDDEKNGKMKKVIRYVRHKNIKQIPEWQRQNPNHDRPNTRNHERYMKIVDNALGGSTDEEEKTLQNKVVKKIASEVTIPKSLRFKLIYN